MQKIAQVQPRDRFSQHRTRLNFLARRRSLVAREGLSSRALKTEAKSMAAQQVHPLRAGEAALEFDASTGTWTLSDEEWKGFIVKNLQPRLMIDFEWEEPESFAVLSRQPALVEYAFPSGAALRLTAQADADGVTLAPEIVNRTDARHTLVRFALRSGVEPAALAFGEAPGEVRILAQGNYWADISRFGAVSSPSEGADPEACDSEILSVFYDRRTKRAFLSAFDSADRWHGRIALSRLEEGSVVFELDLPLGDVLVEPDETIPLEVMYFAAGPNPWKLLEAYGDRLRTRFKLSFPEAPPVSWCSWYPYRHGVTEERMLETARMAAERLKPYGLSVIQADLGWEKDKLPSEFREKPEFPHGLGWLSEQLEALGLQLGVWKAPYCIQESHFIAREHPDWLVCGVDGQPVILDESWFWAPHGKVYLLDLTNAASLEWLRREFTTLREKGVRYFKGDFVSAAAHPMAVHRQDKRIAQGGAWEASRNAAQVIRDALGPEALLLNCGGPELPGAGHWPLNYVCNDTGNTGFLDAEFIQKNTLALAAHLWKHKRWSIIQPSCLCVGLPGGMDEARLRATIAFMSGGQIDVGDTLQTLPEDRWKVLTSVLPPLGNAATPVDLFEPISGAGTYDYTGAVSNGAEGPETLADERGFSNAEERQFEHPPASVWQLRVEAGWDAWDLLAIYAFSAQDADGQPALSRFEIPLERLGLANEGLWGFEFWSGQFLGELPGGRTNPDGYTHPGDAQDLLVQCAPDRMDVSFFGMGAKLIALRRQRDHPFVVGTTFHASCGTELAETAFDASEGILCGVLSRPGVELGRIIAAPADWTAKACRVNGRPAPWLRGANNSVVVPIAVDGRPAEWEIQFER
jgi:hypothetical protein